MNREDLVKKAIELGLGQNEVAVTMDDYFEENDFTGSIMPNVSPEEVHPRRLYGLLKELKSSGDVKEVYVRICEPGEEWPYSDAVYLYTNLFMSDLEEKFTDFMPDEIKIGWMYDRPNGVEEPSGSCQVYTVWWD